MDESDTAADESGAIDSNDDAWLTIDEVAREAGLPASTIRLYQNRGLLPAPERRGRVGYYGPSHRGRLRLIAHLQDRSFSLAAIKEALDSWSAGHSLGDLLGVGAVAPGLVPAPLRLAPEELAARLEGVELTTENMQRAVEIGLIEIDGAEIVVSAPAFLDIGPAVIAMGIPVSVVLDEYEAMAKAVDGVAERFRQVFEEHRWAGFEERGMPVDELADLTTDVERLTSLATAVVTAELQSRFAAMAADYLARVES